MNAERARSFLLSLPHVSEAAQFGGIIFWVADKAIGGKMCAMLNPDSNHEPMSYPATPERFNELVEIEGITPARYLARVKWVTAERWEVFRDREWEDELRAAYTLTLAKLAPRTHTILAMPKAEQKRVIAERRKLLAEREAAKKSARKRV